MIELVILFPFALLWMFLAGLLALALKHLGKFRAWPFLAAASALAAALTAILVLNNLAGYTDLFARGELIVSNGQVQVVGYFLVLKYSLVVAALAAAPGCAFIFIKRLLRRVSQGGATT